LYRGPVREPRDKRERLRDRQTRESEPSAAPPRARQVAASHNSQADTGLRAPQEQRIYGLNACLALFGQRPQALRKVWLLESRLPALKEVLAFCVKHRLGYTLVEENDLEKLSGSAHHEGVVFGTLAAEELSLSAWLRDLAPGPAVALWLDGVGNPHNLGAMLRSAANFGVAGVLLPEAASLALSGAAMRVAEGGAEAVPIVRLGHSDKAIVQLGSAGFAIAAAMVRGGGSLYDSPLPKRWVLVLGAEHSGVRAELARAASLKLAIPGTGAVESLNVAAAAAVFLGEWWRQQKAVGRLQP
jgi:TrmH RNA methyltransferase